MASTRFLTAAAVVFVLVSVPAAAQDPDARHVSLGVAAGIATPFHGDFDFTATAWQADVRFDMSRYFGFGLFFEEWRHRDEQVFNSQVTTTTDHRTRAVGWNLLAKGTAGRVTLSGGGGISYLLYSRDFTQRVIGCEPASGCGGFDQEFNNSSFSAQVQAGVDVAVAPHVAVMGQFRLLVPVEDPGGGHDTFMGGVRFGF